MEKDGKVKIIGTSIGVILFVILILGFTYAWFTWESNRINISGNTSCFNINYTEGNLITSDMLLVDANKLISNNKITIKRGMAVTNLSASKDLKCKKINAKLSIELVADAVPSIYSTSGSCREALNYVIASYDSSLYTVIDARTLENITFDILSTGTITSTGTKTVYEMELANDGTRQDYLIIFYIDGNKANDDIDNKNIIINAKVTAVQISENSSN